MSDISLFRQPYCNKTLKRKRTGASIQSHIILITCLGQCFTCLNEAAREWWLMWCFTWLLLQVMVTSAYTPLPCDHLNTCKCTFLEDYCDMNAAFVPFDSWSWWQKGKWALLWLTEVVTSCLRVLTDLFPGLPLNGTWNCLIFFQPKRYCKRCFTIQDKWSGYRHQYGIQLKFTKSYAVGQNTQHLWPMVTM